MTTKNKPTVSAPRKPDTRKPDTEEPQDVAMVLGRDKESGALGIVRKRADRVEAGIVQPLKEGVPIHGEVIQLHPREGTPLYDVEVHVAAPKTQSSATTSVIPRPAQVATDKYRKNWDQIYRRSARRVLN